MESENRHKDVASSLHPRMKSVPNGTRLALLLFLSSLGILGGSCTVTRQPESEYDRKPCVQASRRYAKKTSSVGSDIESNIYMKWRPAALHDYQVDEFPNRTFNIAACDDFRTRLKFAEALREKALQVCGLSGTGFTPYYHSEAGRDFDVAGSWIGPSYRRLEMLCPPSQK